MSASNPRGAAPGGKGDKPGPFGDEDMDKLLATSPLRDAASQLHEMYMSLRESGFSRREALYLVSKMMTGPSEE